MYGPFVSLSLSILMLWIVGYGAAMVMQQHAWYMRMTRAVLRWCRRQVWPRYRQLIIGLIVGAVLATAYCTPAR